MTTQTIPAGQPGRALKWDVAGTALVNSAFDPDLVAITTADLAKGAAGSAKQAADAAYDATLKAGSVAAFADQALGAAAAAGVSAQAASASRDQAATAALQSEGARSAAQSARDAAVEAQAAAEAARDGSVEAGTASQAVRDQLLSTTGTLGVVTLAEANLALSVLLQQAATGSTAAQLVNAVSDRFTDQSGIAALGGATWTTGRLSNPGGTAMVDRTAGTAIGTMNTWAPVSYAFDGITSKPYVNPGSTSTCIAKQTSNAGFTNTVGKDWGAGVARRVVKFVVHGPNGEYPSPS